MSRETTPSWLENARRTLVDRGRTSTVDDWPSAPKVGDLRVAEPARPGDAEPRLVWVVEVDEGRGVALAALTSNEIELACERDLVFDGDAVGLPFQLMVATDLVAPLFFVQLGRRVATVEGEAAEAMSRALQGESDSVRCGLPFAGSDDPRRAFRSAESVALDRLAADCRSSLEDEPLLVVDPLLFASLPDTGGLDVCERFLTVAEAIEGTPRAEMPVETISQGIDDVEKLLDELSASMGPDLSRAVSTMLQRTLCEQAPPQEDDVLSFRPQRSSHGSASDDELKSMIAPLLGSGERSLRLLTVAGSFPEPARMSAVDSHKFGTVQLIVEAVA